MALSIPAIERTKKLVGSALLGVFIIWTLIPFYWMLVTSLKEHKEIYGTTATLWPHEPTLESYRILFFDTDYLLFFRNSMFVALATTFGPPAHYRTSEVHPGDAAVRFYDELAAQGNDGPIFESPIAFGNGRFSWSSTATAILVPPRSMPKRFMTTTRLGTKQWKSCVQIRRFFGVFAANKVPQGYPQAIPGVINVTPTYWGIGSQKPHLIVVSA